MSITPLETGCASRRQSPRELVNESGYGLAKIAASAFGNVYQNADLGVLDVFRAF